MFDIPHFIQKAQEMVDAKDYAGALKLLNNLYNPDKLTEYEQSNVLNYIGFVYYNMWNRRKSDGRSAKDKGLS